MYGIKWHQKPVLRRVLQMAWVKEATLTAQMDFYFNFATFYEYDLSHLIPNRLSQPEQNT
jgi:hypothetical protein